MEEFLKHLRSIHFAMLISAVTILIALSSSNSKYMKALEQLRDVNQLLDEFNADFIAKSIDQEVELPWSMYNVSEKDSMLKLFVEEGFLQYLESIEFGGELDAFSLSTESFFSFYEFDDPPPKVHMWFEQKLCLLGDGDSFFSNAAEFRAMPLKLSNMLSALESVLRLDVLYVKPGIDFGFHFEGSSMAGYTLEATKKLEGQIKYDERFSIDAELKHIKMTDSESRLAYEDIQMILNEDPIGYEQYDGGFDAFEMKCNISIDRGGESREEIDFVLMLPMMFQTQNVEFIGQVLKRLRTADDVYPRYLSGACSCEDLFPELFEVTEHLRSLQFQDLERFFIEQAKKNSSPIGILGLNINRNLVEVWGIVLMLCIQLYFCIHYHAFSNQRFEKNELTFPWLGLYSSTVSKIVFNVSHGLPSFVCAFSIFQNGSGALKFRAILTILSIALFIWTIWNHKKQNYLREF